MKDDARRQQDASASGALSAATARGVAGLTRAPKLLHEVSIDYPPEAGTRSGRVVLQVRVSAVGTVDDVAVVIAEPQGLFEEAAMGAFSRADFAPGELLGVPVASEIRIEVEFTPIDRGAVSGRGY